MEAEPVSRGTEDLCLLSAGQSAARAKGRPQESSSHGPGRPETGGKPPATRRVGWRKRRFVTADSQRLRPWK